MLSSGPDAGGSTWHSLAAAEIVRRLGTDSTRGLDTTEAARRLATYEPNELKEVGRRTAWGILWSQLTATMMLLLIVAGVVETALGDFRNAIAIAAIVILNAALGFSQERGAEKAIAALKRLAVPKVKVRRNGTVREVSASELVPGDVVLLESGNLVPADCRLLSSFGLRVQAAVLTGESEPTDKDADVIEPADVPITERRNMIYMGTLVTAGRAEAVTTATGMCTELGRIAGLMQAVQRQATPLQRRLGQLGGRLAVLALAIVLIIFVVGLLRGVGMKLMFLAAVSIAVAAVPEGLPAVVTVALALGAQRMLRRQALIRKLPAVETLGSVTVICADKTGTLTSNRMTVTVLDVAGHHLDLDSFDLGTEARATIQERPALAVLLAAGTLCNDALLQPDGAERNGIQALGDPTETSIAVAAARLGLRKPELEATFPRVAEAGFDSHRKRMSTMHRADTPGALPLAGLATLAQWSRGQSTDDAILFTKGAVDGLLSVSGRVWLGAGTEPLDTGGRQRIAAANDELAQRGIRVLGVAFRTLPSAAADRPIETYERDLIFVGMIGMTDPPRPEAADAVQRCRRAGIRPVMITGDQAITARQVARAVGIAADDDVVEGRALDSLGADALAELAAKTSVYARVSPTHKLQIVEALQLRGEIVAMTGDGVNDAPALRRADIGVAMGRIGTDVAKEAADMVLLDDNFATIVAAVEEGRVIYDNIYKFLKYLMTTNAAELGVMLFGPAVGMPLPLLPLQILWMNLVTDGPPALALSVEPAEHDVMRRPPRRPDERLLDRDMAVHVAWVCTLMVLISLGLSYWYWSEDHASWQTMLFTTLSISQMGHVLAIRSGRESLFRVGLLSNRPLLGAVVLTIALQLAIVYLPFAQRWFQTVSLSAGSLALSLAVSTLIFWAVELEKWVRRRRLAVAEDGSRD